jgi:hypothetical protein
MQDLVISQVTLSAVSVVVMQWIKGSKLFPFITATTDKLNKVVAAVLAGVTAIGVHYTYDATTATLTVVGLSWAALGHAAWHWLQSYAFQETIYKGAFHKPAPVVEPAPKP